MPKSGSKKIMVVDDNEDIVFMLRSVLEKDGYQVVEAKSGEECLRKVENAQPDLILMDIMMPGIDGWEVCKKIKESELLISVPISMLSVRKDSADLKKSFEYAHADAHLKKPVNFEALRRTVSSLV
jgi:CheY-like chemotaxis protein